MNKHGGITAKLCQFTILTASRPSNARLAVWPEVFLDKTKNPDAPIQITKREEMKIKRVIKFDKETPLSTQAVALLKTLPRFMIKKGNDFIFPIMKKDGTICPISYSSATVFIKKINVERRKSGEEPFVDHNVKRDGEPVSISLHGTARASFETWAYDSVRFNHKQFSEKAIEHCLDHVTEKYNNAYLRRAVIGEMREIFQAWGDYCFSISSNA